MDKTTYAIVSYSQETKASATAILKFFQDVSHWKDWNARVFACTLNGPFTVGSWMTMVLPDQTIIQSRLIEVNEPYSFTDETILENITVRVKHKITALSAGRNRITYEIEVIGESAQDVCLAVSSDFPKVLSALAAKAEGHLAMCSDQTAAA